MRVELRTQRRAAELRGLERVVLHVLETELERGHAAQDVLDLGRILHAGQLHVDAVETLALHDRLGHAQLVDPVAQRRDVLLDRVVLALAHLGGREHREHRGAAGDAVQW